MAAVPAPGPVPDGLYADMGGQAGIEMLVVALLGHIADDPRIAAKFANVNLLNLNDRLVEQFCVVAGGPCTYTGKPMVEAHRHVDVGPADFNALVEDLQAAMDGQGISQRAQNRFLARLAAMQRQVLHAPPKLDPAAPPMAIP